MFRSLTDEKMAQPLNLIRMSRQALRDSTQGAFHAGTIRIFQSGIALFDRLERFDAAMQQKQYRIIMVGLAILISTSEDNAHLSDPNYQRLYPTHTYERVIHLYKSKEKTIFPAHQKRFATMQNVILNVGEGALNGEIPIVTISPVVFRSLNRAVPDELFQPWPKARCVLL